MEHIAAVAETYKIGRHVVTTYIKSVPGDVTWVACVRACVTERHRAAMAVRVQQSFRSHVLQMTGLSRGIDLSRSDNVLFVEIIHWE